MLPLTEHDRRERVAEALTDLSLDVMLAMNKRDVLSVRDRVAFVEAELGRLAEELPA